MNTQKYLRDKKYLLRHCGALPHGLVGAAVLGACLLVHLVTTDISKEGDKSLW